jgi:uncharacterized membrane protein YidH (DUF202 family)
MLIGRAECMKLTFIAWLRSAIAALFFARSIVGAFITSPGVEGRR